ncbi:MAG: AF1514 family protein [Gammaproteobacteria bacterium]|nr:AF1514 family protein [Gammaproteobacteria bacterium]MBU1414467.1 AF1514 family protein [Gammaproteobacteria bacterium]
MKTLNASQLFPGGATASRFASARALAFSLAESDSELLEPELVAWIDRHSTKTSPVLEGCGGPDGWRDYGASHGGRLEVDVNGEAAFIFAESSPFDSYSHFSPGPFINLRDSRGNESVCRVGGLDCVPLDDWTSQMT